MRRSLPLSMLTDRTGRRPADNRALRRTPHRDQLDQQHGHQRRTRTRVPAGQSGRPAQRVAEADLAAAVHDRLDDGQRLPDRLGAAAVEVRLVAAAAPRRTRNRSGGRRRARPTPPRAAASRRHRRGAPGPPSSARPAPTQGSTRLTSARLQTSTLGSPAREAAASSTTRTVPLVPVTLTLAPLGASGPCAGHSVSPTRSLPRPPAIGSSTRNTRPTCCCARTLRSGTSLRFASGRAVRRTRNTVATAERVGDELPLPRELGPDRQRQRADDARGEPEPEEMHAWTTVSSTSRSTARTIQFQAQAPEELQHRRAPACWPIKSAARSCASAASELRPADAGGHFPPPNASPMICASPARDDHRGGRAASG